MFCHFWRMAPSDVDEMPIGMRDTFTRYQNEWIREQRRQAK